MIQHDTEIVWTYHCIYCNVHHTENEICTESDHSGSDDLGEI